MPRRPGERAARLRHGHPQRVPDPAAADLGVAREQRQDRQSRGVGARPAGGPQPRPAQVPGRAGAGVPAVTLAAEREQLVEPAARAVQQQRMAVAVGVRPALDVHAAGDRVAHAVGLAGVVEAHARARRAPPDDVVGDPDRPALPEAGAEVGLDRAADPDRADDRRGVGRDRQPVDALVGREREGRAAGDGGRRGGGKRQEHAGVLSARAQAIRSKSLGAAWIRPGTSQGP